jgi:hypothetical protein
MRRASTSHPGSLAESRGRFTHEPGPGHRGAERQRRQVIVQGAPDKNGRTNVRVVHVWQNRPDRSWPPSMWRTRGETCVTAMWMNWPDRSNLRLRAWIEHFTPDSGRVQARLEQRLRADTSPRPRRPAIERELRRRATAGRARSADRRRLRRAGERRAGGSGESTGAARSRIDLPTLSGRRRVNGVPGRRGLQPIARGRAAAGARGRDCCHVHTRRAYVMAFRLAPGESWSRHARAEPATPRRRRQDRSDDRLVRA